MSDENRKKLRRARNAFFGTRHRIASFFISAADTRIPPRLGGLRWMPAAIVLLFALQLFTGILLSLYYYPEPEQAYHSTRFLLGEVSSGWLTRSIHHWAGELLLLAVLVHVAAVFFRRDYVAPREYQWVAGAFLLLAVFVFRFTGRLLPWDTIGYHATRHGLGLFKTVPLIGPVMATWLRGGEDMGPNTLSRFFTTHVLILPWCAVFVGGLHFYLARRHAREGEDS
ncbi:MAG: cytochrome b N-terminal domain-containing protein [Planctomycetota bacterium]